MKTSPPELTPVPDLTPDWADVILPQSGGCFIAENGVLKPDENTPFTQHTAPLGRAPETEV